jgi:hypothetical protein
MSDARTLALAHVDRAVAEGRTLTDTEVELIDAIAASTPSEPDAPATISAAPRLTAAAPPAALRLPGGFSLSRDDAEALLTAARSRAALTVTAAAGTWATHATSTGTLPNNARLLDILDRDGAIRAEGTARNLDYAHIASGDAGIWTTGNKAEISTALASTPAIVAAAFTLVPELARLDITALDQIVAGLLARRVIAKENGAIGTAIATAATNGTDTNTAEGTVAEAISGVYANGFTPNRLLVASDIYAGVMTGGKVGFLGDASTFGGTLMGVPATVVGGLAAGTAVALDATALTYQASGLLVAVGVADYQANTAFVRVETSSAVAVLDAAAAVASVKTTT